MSATTRSSTTGIASTTLKTFLAQDAAVCGHWHQLASIPVNHRILWVNGSTESGNTWLQEELKAQCPPGQWLLFCHPEKARITAEVRVWLQ